MSGKLKLNSIQSIREQDKSVENRPKCLAVSSMFQGGARELPNIYATKESVYAPTAKASHGVEWFYFRFIRYAR